MEEDSDVDGMPSESDEEEEEPEEEPQRTGPAIPPAICSRRRGRIKLMTTPR